MGHFPKYKAKIIQLLYNSFSLKNNGISQQTWHRQRSMRQSTKSTCCKWEKREVGFHLNESTTLRKKADLEKIFTPHISDKELVSIIYKALLHIKNKNTNNLIKMDKIVEQTLHKRRHTGSQEALRKSAQHHWSLGK